MSCLQFKLITLIACKIINIKFIEIPECNKARKKDLKAQAKNAYANCGR